MNTRFSPTVLEHVARPLNMGELPAPDAVGTSDVAEGGQFVRIQLALQGSVIADARFQTIGCAPAIACGSWLTEWVRGRTAHDALQITAHQIMHALGGLPADKQFCAELAIVALRRAIQASSPLERKVLHA